MLSLNELSLKEPPLKECSLNEPSLNTNAREVPEKKYRHMQYVRTHDSANNHGRSDLNWRATWVEEGFFEEASSKEGYAGARFQMQHVHEEVI